MMSNSWSWYVIALSVLNIIAMLWLLIATSKNDVSTQDDTTGHEWDGIKELNNPLPRWWFGLFILTIVFAAIYLYLYPGLGNYKGSLDWSQMGQYQQSLDKNREQQKQFFADFAGLDAVELATNAKAMDTAERLFLNNCSTCHGSNAKGAKGFPNLSDDDWLYGGSAETIKTTITNGRAGVMPMLGLSKSNISILSHYVKGLHDGSASDHVKSRGKELFASCAACHGADAKGNQALGAPNLTDNIWLHGSSIADIEYVLANGKQGNMPSFKSLLSEDEIRLLTAYVLSLQNK